jgi:hypothetical protein
VTGIVRALLVVPAGAAAIMVLGGLLAVTAGLVAVAALTGWLTGAALRATGGRRRVALAVALAVGAIALGQLGLWGFAWLEGGRLGPLDYLTQTYGVLVPAEIAAAALVAWGSAR